jgi:hypothetical protein
MNSVDMKSNLAYTTGNYLTMGKLTKSVLAETLNFLLEPKQ